MALKSTAFELNKSEKQQSDTDYASFEALDGTHPWREAVPEGSVAYPVRQLPFGRVAYFNFKLAKEMGLISADHVNKLNRKLEKKILETFNLRIINEYDQQNKIQYQGSKIKTKTYMATRYLQLQHPDKRGMSSGDGRCIWNGTIKHKGVTWDVSSRGTGVTCLSPGYVEAGRPLKSGNNDFGYGCGLAEIDELYGSAIMAEVFHLNNINTERILAVIDTGKGIGIGVRASQNLVRPAHLFLYLKQNRWDALRRATDYLIKRQFDNSSWTFSNLHRKKYDYFLNQICESFAQFAAQLEREYIFAWLDWDGDNVLASAGIIDYGSVRQFGLRHDEYRYDDVSRFSTNLNEQRSKARLTVQVFIQLVDFLKNKSKKPLVDFKKHPLLKQFDQHFEYYLRDHFLYQMGFSRKRREYLLKKERRAVDRFYEQFLALERVKTRRKNTKVADGVNRPAIFKMRTWSRQTALHMLLNPDVKNLTTKDLKKTFKSVLASHASRIDSKTKLQWMPRLKQLYRSYRKIVLKSAPDEAQSKVLKEIESRSRSINREDRLTGNGLINIVYEILKSRNKGLDQADLQKAFDAIISHQILNPEVTEDHLNPRLHTNSASFRLVNAMIGLIDGHKEDI